MPAANSDDGETRSPYNQSLTTHGECQSPTLHNSQLISDDVFFNEEIDPI